MESMTRTPNKYDVNPEYKKRRKNRFPKCWCFLLVVLVLIAVIAGGAVGILKAIQSSGSSGMNCLSFRSASLIDLRLIS